MHEEKTKKTSILIIITHLLLKKESYCILFLNDMRVKLQFSFLCEQSL